MSFVCNSCNKEFKSLQALNGHKAFCGKEKIECPYCHEKFLYANIEKHMEKGNGRYYRRKRYREGKSY